MNSKSSLSSLILASLAVLGLISSAALAHIPIPPKASSEVGRRVVKTAVLDFTLTDQDGKVFRLASARGKLLLVTFIFTTCPDVCPLLTAKFAAIQRTLQEKKTNDVTLLSITTDPERDSAAALKDYANRFKADTRNWSFLTGSRQELVKVWKAFGVNVTKTESGDVQHTGLTTLIDRQTIRRVDYYGDKWPDKEVLKDIQWLRTQKQ